MSESNTECNVTLPPLHGLQQFETRDIARSQIENAPYNPRKIAQANRIKLEQLLTEFGLVETLVWNERSGNLVGGHQRLVILDALSDSGENYSLTVAAVDLDETREKALNASLNAKSAQGEYDIQKLDSLLNELEGQIEIELSSLFASERKLQRLIKRDLAPHPPDSPAGETGDTDPSHRSDDPETEISPAPERSENESSPTKKAANPSPPISQVFEVIVKCLDETEQRVVFDLLTEQGHRCLARSA
jgi:hypothetical protein